MYDGYAYLSEVTQRIDEVCIEYPTHQQPKFSQWTTFLFLIKIPFYLPEFQRTFFFVELTEKLGFQRLLMDIFICRVHIKKFKKPPLIMIIGEAVFIYSFISS